MLNKELEQTLNNAFVFAREHRHEFMTVGTLLLALLDNSALAMRSKHLVPVLRQLKANC